jgi:hypothetical protein
MIGKLLLPVAVVFVFTGCAARRPVLYPNERLKQVSREVAERDVDECMRQADEYMGSGRGGEVAGHAAVGAGTGAAVGAAAGAAGGAVVGQAGRGAAVGAAGGGAAGLTRGLLGGLFKSREPSLVYKNYVHRCLSDKGYDPIGWK